MEKISVVIKWKGYIKKTGISSDNKIKKSPDKARESSGKHHSTASRIPLWCI